MLIICLFANRLKLFDNVNRNGFPLFNISKLRNIDPGKGISTTKAMLLNTQIYNGVNRREISFYRAGR